MMDKTCDDVAKKKTNEDLRGLFDGDYLASFRMPDGTRFIDRKGTEGHYAFSLNIDYFNMEGMRICGAKTSCGIVLMACLNLPVDIRYKPENMYLAGITPGPEEPSLTEANHYIKSLVNDLIDGYDPGIQFSRTALQTDIWLAVPSSLQCVT